MNEQESNEVVGGGEDVHASKPTGMRSTGTAEAGFKNRRSRSLAWLLVAACCLTGCGPKAPIRIGLLAGLSERTAAFSEDGRNGVMLAIEQRNQAGGVAGRQLELIVQDYGTAPEKATAAVQALIDARVDTVIGPYSSDVAVQMLPQVDKARLLVLSPVVSAVALAGKDDYLIRLNRTTRDNARDLARQLYERGQRRLALATDVRNPAYYVSLRDDFRLAFTELGGTVVADAEFGRHPDTSFEDVVRTMLAGRPDGLVASTTSVDAALIAQQAVKQTRGIPMAAVYGSEALIELGGQAVEGMLVAQAHNRADTSARYQAFCLAYVARFGREPTYSAVFSYDAVTVATEALARSAKGESLRDAVLRNQPYQGVQEPIRFDRFGDSARAAYYSIVRNGQFVPL